MCGNSQKPEQGKAEFALTVSTFFLMPALLDRLEGITEDIAVEPEAVAA